MLTAATNEPFASDTETAIRAAPETRSRFTRVIRASEISSWKKRGRL